MTMFLSMLFVMMALSTVLLGMLAMVTGSMLLSVMLVFLVSLAVVFVRVLFGMMMMVSLVMAMLFGMMLFVVRVALSMMMLAVVFLMSGSMFLHRLSFLQEFLGLLVFSFDLLHHLLETSFGLVFLLVLLGGLLG